MEISTIAMYVGSMCFALSIIWAGILDIATMTIRNELVLFLVAVYAALAPLTGVGITTIGLNTALATVVLASLFILFSIGWIGGGDAKLAAVVALWVGSEHTGDFLLYTALFGGLLTLIVLQFRSISVPHHWLQQRWINRLYDPQSGVPYGAAIAAGGLAVLPSTSWCAALL